MHDKILENIENQLGVISESLKWADTYGKDTFSRKDFKEYRRSTKKIKRALQNRCSVAAYGESQVGKSYLMSGLLSSTDAPFVINNGGREYSFVDEINPSGGNKTKIESTGLITRFTTKPYDNPAMAGYVKISNLSIIDLIMLILDSYYNDIKINPKTSLSSKEINERLQQLQGIWSSKTSKQSFIDEDDVRDIQDYVFDVIGNGASNILHSDFFDTVAQNIEYIPVDKWPHVFELLWNLNPNMTRLFTNLISEFGKISFSTEVYVPFDAILRKNGTLLKIQWLDLICGREAKDDDFPVLTTDVYDPQGNKLASGFSKAFLSAITAEITVVLPEAVTADRPFLKNIDLLDFPGARTRLDKPEVDIDYTTDMPEILRRGKVAFLFNSYVRERKISSILFCHHNDQKTESTIGNAIKTWVEEIIGKTPAERTEYLKNTAGISPLFMVATKFNIDLSKDKDDHPGALTNHWRRFSEVIPEIIGSYQWFDNWEETATGVKPFRNIYPLRDFYWSGNTSAGMSNLFQGYSDGSNGPKSEETDYHVQPGFPGYFDELRDSFVANPFVQDHFDDPLQAWNDVATRGNDGTKPIIKALDRIAVHLDEARRAAYTQELKAIRNHIKNALEVYYEPDNDEAKSEKIKRISSRIRARLFMLVGSDPAVFGRIIDSLMVEPEALRKIARDIIVLKTDTPKDFSVVNFIRANAGINPGDGKDVNLKKLLNFFGMTQVEELEEEFAGKEYTVNDIISGEQEFCTTVADVITKHILDYWIEHLNHSITSLNRYLPFTDDIVLTFQTLVEILGVKKLIKEKIALYDRMFGTNERLTAIADYASLVLNNFISTVGRKYMTEANIEEIRGRANRCGIEVDLTPGGIEPMRRKQPLVEVLAALDESTEIMHKPGINATDMLTLRKLPLWDNFQRWQNLLVIGIILSSGISTKDPRANSAIKEILDKIDNIFN